MGDNYSLRYSYYILFTVFLFTAACNKKDKDPVEEPAGPVIIPDTGLKCGDLPAAPIPFGWTDTLTDGNKCINAFMFDPINPNKIIYVVNGDAAGYNKLFFYDVPSKQAKYVCTLGEYLPQVNSKGWIVFSDVENNVQLIKGNNDSIIALTNNKHARDPKWDYSENKVLYFSEPHDNIPAKMIEVDISGQLIAEFEANAPYAATFKKSNKIIVLEINTTTCKLTQKDLDGIIGNRTLLSGPTYSKPGQINFDNLTLDRTDENFYWSNSYGIFKCNLASLKVDTLFKNCQNFIFNNPMISFKDNELTYSHEVISPINSLKLYHQFRAMELNLVTWQTTEIKIYP